MLRHAEPVQRSVRPGELERFVVDVPSSGRCRLRVRMDRRGGDPVLMASCGEWPSVDLDGATDDLVRAHYCAFEDFQTDATSHELLISSADMPRPPKPVRPRAGSGSGPEFPAAAAGQTRWAVCVFNFPLSRYERSSIQLIARIEHEGSPAVGRPPVFDALEIGTAPPPELPPEHACSALQVLGDADSDAGALGEIARFLALARADRPGGGGGTGAGGGGGGGFADTDRGVGGGGGGGRGPCVADRSHSVAYVPPSRRALTPAFPVAAARPHPHGDIRAAGSSACDSNYRLGTLAPGLAMYGHARCRRGALVLRAMAALVSETRGGGRRAGALLAWRYAAAAIAAEAAVGESDRRRDELEFRRGELDSRAAELVERASELDVQGSELESRRLELDSRASELEQRGSVLDSRASELEQRGSELDSRASELEQRGSELDSRASELEQRGSELDSRASELEQRGSELEQAVCAAHEAVTAAACGLSAAGEGARHADAQEVAAAVAAAEVAAEAAATAAAEAEKAMAEARAEAARARAEAATAQAAVSAAEDTAAAALERVAAAEARSATVTGSCEVSCSQLVLSDGREDLRSQLDALRSQLAMGVRQGEGQLRGETIPALDTGARGVGRGRLSGRLVSFPATASRATLSTISAPSRTAVTEPAANPPRAAILPNAAAPPRVAVSSPPSILSRAGLPAESLPSALAAANASLTCLAAAVCEADQAAAAAAAGRRAADARTAAAETVAEAAVAAAEEARAELYQEQARAEAAEAAAADAISEAISEARRDWSGDDVRFEILGLRRDLRAAMSEQRAAVSGQRESDLEAAAAMEAARALAAAHAEARLRADMLVEKLGWAEEQAAAAAVALDSTREGIQHGEAVAAATRQAAEELQAENSRQRQSLDKLKAEIRRLSRGLEKAAAREAQLSLALETVRREAEMSEAERCAAAERSIAAWVAAPAAGMLAQAVDAISPPLRANHAQILPPHVPPVRSHAAGPPSAPCDFAPYPNGAPTGSPPYCIVNGAHPYFTNPGTTPHCTANGANPYATCTSLPPPTCAIAAGGGDPSPPFAPRGMPPVPAASSSGGGWVSAQERAAAVSIALRGASHPPPSPPPPWGGGGWVGGDAGTTHLGAHSGAGQATAGEGGAPVNWVASPVEPRLTPNAAQADTDALLQVARAVRSLEERIQGSLETPLLSRGGADTAGGAASGGGALNIGGGGGQLDAGGRGGRFQLRALFRIEQTGSPYQRECAREELSRWGQGRRAEAVRLERAWSVCREWVPMTRALFAWAKAASVHAVAAQLRRGRAVWRWRATALALELRATNRTLFRLSEDMAAERSEAVAAAAVASVAADDAAAKAVRASFQRWEVERSRLLDFAASQGATAAAEAARRVEQRLGALALLCAAAANTAGGHRAELLQAWLQRWRCAVLSTALASAAAAVAKASRRAVQSKQAIADARMRQLQFVMVSCWGLQLSRGAGRALERWRALTRMPRLPPSAPPPPPPARPPPPPPGPPRPPLVTSTYAASPVPVCAPRSPLLGQIVRPSPAGERAGTGETSPERQAAANEAARRLFGGNLAGNNGTECGGSWCVNFGGNGGGGVHWRDSLSLEAAGARSDGRPPPVAQRCSSSALSMEDGSRDASGDVSGDVSGDTAPLQGGHRWGARGAYPGPARPGGLRQGAAARGAWQPHTPIQPFPTLPKTDKSSPASSPAASPQHVPTPGTSPPASPPRTLSPLSSPLRASSVTSTPRPLISQRNSTASILSSAPPLLTGASSFFLDAEPHDASSPPPYWTIPAAVAAARAMERAMPALSSDYDARCLAGALCMWRGFVAGAGAAQGASPRARSVAVAVAGRFVTLAAVNVERAARALALWWAVAALMGQKVAHTAARRRAIEATARAVVDAAPHRHATTTPAQAHPW